MTRQSPASSLDAGRPRTISESGWLIAACLRGWHAQRHVTSRNDQAKVGKEICKRLQSMGSQFLKISRQFHKTVSCPLCDQAVETMAHWRTCLPAARFPDGMVRGVVLDSIHLWASHCWFRIGAGGCGLPTARTIQAHIIR
jgi:hypothetical protein